MGAVDGVGRGGENEDAEERLQWRLGRRALASPRAIRVSAEDRGFEGGLKRRQRELGAGDSEARRDDEDQPAVRPAGHAGKRVRGQDCLPHDGTAAIGPVAQEYFWQAKAPAPPRSGFVCARRGVGTLVVGSSEPQPMRSAQVLTQKVRTASAADERRSTPMKTNGSSALIAAWARYEITYPIAGNRSLTVTALKAYRSRNRKGAVGPAISERSLCCRPTRILSLLLTSAPPIRVHAQICGADGKPSRAATRPARGAEATAPAKRSAQWAFPPWCLRSGGGRMLRGCQGE